MRVRGFTFIETLITLSISLILVSFVLIEMWVFYLATNHEAVKAQVLEAIQLALEEVEIRHVPIVLCNSNNARTCGGEWAAGQLVFMNEKQDGVVKNPKDILAVFQHKRQGVLHWRSFPRYRDYLLFLPNGFMHTDNSLFWYCSNLSSPPLWAIAISKSGRVRVINPNRNHVIYDAHGKVLQC